MSSLRLNGSRGVAAPHVSIDAADVLGETGAERWAAAFAAAATDDDADYIGRRSGTAAATSAAPRTAGVVTAAQTPAPAQTPTRVETPRPTQAQMQVLMQAQAQAQALVPAHGDGGDASSTGCKVASKFHGQFLLYFIIFEQSTQLEWGGFSN